MLRVWRPQFNYKLILVNCFLSDPRRESITVDKELPGNILICSLQSEVKTKAEVPNI